MVVVYNKQSITYTVSLYLLLPSNDHSDCCQVNELSADLADKERRCTSQSNEILTLSDQVHRLTAEVKQATTTKEDLSQTVRIFVYNKSNWYKVDTTRFY